VTNQGFNPKLTTPHRMVPLLPSLMGAGEQVTRPPKREVVELKGINQEGSEGYVNVRIPLNKCGVILK
jgi:hypothetical protein